MGWRVTRATEKSYSGNKQRNNRFHHYILSCYQKGELRIPDRVLLKKVAPWIFSVIYCFLACKITNLPLDA